MAACRDIPPHMAAPPDGGHAVTMAHHVGHARCVGGGGILLFFHGQGCRVISSLTHVRVRRFLAPFSRHRGGGYGCWVLRADLARADLPLPCARFTQRSSSPPLALVPPCFLAFPGLFRGSIPPSPFPCGYLWPNPFALRYVRTNTGVRGGQHAEIRPGSQEISCICVSFHAYFPAGCHSGRCFGHLQSALTLSSMPR